MAGMEREVIVMFVDKYGHTEIRQLAFRPLVGDYIAWHYSPPPKITSCMIRNCAKDMAAEDMKCEID